MTVFVRGRVQGVGFRWWTRARALELGLAGHARNTDDGRVEVVAEGDPAALLRLLDLLAEQPSSTRRPGPGRVGVGAAVGRAARRAPASSSAEREVRARHPGGGRRQTGAAALPTMAG